MNEGEKRPRSTRAEILKEIEEDEVLIERARRECAEAPRVILEAERSLRRMRQIIRQLART